LTESLVVEQRWQTNAMAWDQLRTPPQNAPGVDGNLYSKKGIGVSLLALPLFALGKLWPTVGAVQVALLTNALITAATVYLFYRLTLALTFPPTTAGVGALVLGVATPLWPYARTLFSESLAAFGLCLALTGAVCYRQTVGNSDRNGGVVGPLLGISGGLACLVLARSIHVILVVPFLLYLGTIAWAARPKRHWLLPPYRQLFAFALPLGMALLLTMLYNYLRFHTWLTFPQAAFETFSMPLFTGVVGLLVSPGKGLFWYMPCALLLFFTFAWWREQGRLPEWGLAISLVVVTLLIYAKWYDWTGGRAWGPRMMVMTAPALILLLLPVLDRQVQGIGRWLIGAILLLSVVVQLPGVLLNFELLEAEQMKQGITFDQLVWSPAHTPLLTYWHPLLNGIMLDPVWWHSSFWQQPMIYSGAFIGVGLAFLCTLAWGVRRSLQAKPTSAWWVVSVSMALIFAAIMVSTAAVDPRWQERTANPVDNRAVVDYLQTQVAPGDLALLDMSATTDHQGRQGFWMNHGVRGMPYLAWVRNSNVLALDEQLATWLAPHGRIWLVMQETVENAPDATTERWLDDHAYRGRQRWIGGQRLVEYMQTTANTPLITQDAPLRFGDVAVLESYRVRPGALPSYVLVDLVWQAQPAEPWRFSLQALDNNGQLVAQLDDRPARLPGRRDQLGLNLPPTTQRVILKLYDSQSGQATRIEIAGEITEFLPLLTVDSNN
jgi:hypothetical protein